MDLFGTVTWTRQELAAVLGLTPMRITQLVQEGVLPKPVRAHQHEPKAAVAAYLKHVQQTKTSGEREREETEKLRLGNAMTRLKLDRASGELMSRDAVNQAWFAAGRQVRDTLENLPDRLAGPLAAETDQAAVYLLLKNEFHQLLEMLSRLPDVKARKILAAVGE